MITLTPEIVVIIAGVLLANIGALLGFFVSLKVGIVRLEVKVDTLEKDVNNIGELFRQLKKEIQNASVCGSSEK